MNLTLLNGALALMPDGPKSLSRALNASSSMQDMDGVDVAELEEYLLSASAGDDIIRVFRRALLQWDHEPNNSWTQGVTRNTVERRELIYSLLQLSQTFIAICNQRFPFSQLNAPVVIAAEHTRWYTSEIRNARSFYWSAYVKQLEAQGWSDSSIRQLDESTTSVVERLSEPSSPAAFQSKGLVVGYVQSGKTANFTGVIAKAADAGYKFIIILAGMLDVLRSQTQRRIDKDMIGQELLDEDYISDVDWDTFLKHGAKPSTLGSFDWYRLTGPESDYRELGRGVEALKFEGSNPNKPLWERENLLSAGTRIAILKKNSNVLRRLLDDLVLLKRNQIGSPLDQVPTLLIDDESDQASINVKKANDNGVVERTATNKAIVELLNLLPRAQYVGYTATPFANVFVDPNNEEDIFPKDFLVSLPRPVDYMGVSDFYDLEGSQLDPESRPNERDYIRAVKGDDGEPENLLKAIDSFVLSGAIKLYRQSIDPLVKFRHHTMLVHSSARVLEHSILTENLKRLFERAAYEGGAGLDRLEHLFSNDFAPVSKRRGANHSFPLDFADVARFIAECLSKIGNPGDAVLTLNNENREQTPDFDREAIWKFVVGGTKLSRGYTVEGLTISYYRRRAATADTLMQMGRWFGFRSNYSDLVRLFIGTEEKLDKRGLRVINLYDAFGAVCRDEEMFRADLLRYASMDEPRILPRQIPPLVPSHMLKPTAPNKMYNAKITYRNFGGQLSESTFAPTQADLILENSKAFNTLLAGVNVESLELVAKKTNGSKTAMNAKVARLAPAAVLKLIESYKWYDKGPTSHSPSPMLEQIDFLRQVGARDPGIDEWILIAPQISGTRAHDLIAGSQFGVVYRSRLEGGNRFGTYNDPVHRRFAEYITGKSEMDAANSSLASLRQAKRAVMLLYIITDIVDAAKAKPPYTRGFTLLFPFNDIKSPITFGVRRQDHPEALVVSTGKH